MLSSEVALTKRKKWQIVVAGCFCWIKWSESDVELELNFGTAAGWVASWSWRHHDENDDENEDLGW